MTARYIIGDSLEVLRTLPAGSVDLVVTSPPYLALRSYLAADDPNKVKEMGSEGTPAAFIDALLDVTEELRRVLTPHGSLCLELGDTYSGSGGSGGDYTAEGLHEGQPKFRQVGSREHRPEREGTGADGGARLVPISGGTGWPISKSLCMIPELYRVALAYGRNPLNGRECSTWRCRNVVRHFRPNPPVGALGDKTRPATSDWIVACTSRTRYFDLDSVRGAASPNTHARTAKGVESLERSGKSAERDGNWASMAELHETAGAPPLDWWADDDLEWRDGAGFIAPTFGYPGSHYATFSPAVIKRLILPQCPRRVCTVCGEPSRRIVETEKHGLRIHAKAPDHRSDRNDWNAERSTSTSTSTTTLGWTTCGHDAWRPGVVLDPFGGSGVTGMVATGLGLDAILIDLDERNAHLAAERVGMFLQVEHHQPTEMTA